MTTTTTLRERERQLLALLDEPHTLRSLARACGYSPKTLQPYLSALRQRDLVSWRWRNDGVYWERVRTPQQRRPQRDSESRVLEQLSLGPRSTAELAEALGVTKGRIWQLLSPLLERRIVERAELRHRGRGRPMAAFRLVDTAGSDERVPACRTLQLNGSTR
jgi:DNA-binding MarR family transcriptional regulator